MNVTDELNAPDVRNDANTTHAVMSHIRVSGYVFGEVHIIACVREALEANDAAEGCRIADAIAAKLEHVRQRFNIHREGKD